MAHYASPFYQNLLSLSEHRVPQLLTTTYMDDYQWPYRPRKKLTLDDLKPPVELAEMKVLRRIPGGVSESQELDGKQNKKTKHRKFDNRNWKENFGPDDPEWKIAGWKAAENFWLRPLIERQEYVQTFGKIWEDFPSGRRESKC